MGDQFNLHFHASKQIIIHRFNPRTCEDQEKQKAVKLTISICTFLSKIFLGGITWSVANFHNNVFSTLKSLIYWNFFYFLLAAFYLMYCLAWVEDCCHCSICKKDEIPSWTSHCRKNWLRPNFDGRKHRQQEQETWQRESSSCLLFNALPCMIKKITPMQCSDTCSPLLAWYI